MILLEGLDYIYACEEEIEAAKEAEVAQDQVTISCAEVEGGCDLCCD